MSNVTSICERNMNILIEFHLLIYGIYSIKKCCEFHEQEVICMNRNPRAGRSYFILKYLTAGWTENGRRNRKQQRYFVKSSFFPCLQTDIFRSRSSRMKLHTSLADLKKNKPAMEPTSYPTTPKVRSSLQTSLAIVI